ncbi:MAG: alkaline phosphatase family protein, partial [Acidobacteriota bacterium]
ALGGYHDVAFVVGVKPGYYIGGGHEGPVVRMGKRGGSHGFLPEIAEMNSAFFIAGPGVPKGKNLGQIDMRDIAPTLAGILKVRLPAAEGRDLFSLK